MRRVRGFSLLELIVVLAIVALLAGLVPSVLSGLGLTTELRGSAARLAAGLRTARTLAVTRQREAAVMLDLEQRVFNVSGSTRSVALPDERVTIKLHTARSEVDDEDSGRIRFFPDGSSTGGNITLADDKVVYRVNVDWLTGRVDVVTEDATP